MKTRRHARGFSLIEVLIAIAIVLAIGGLVAINLLPEKDQADRNIQQIQFDQLDRALKGFKLDLARWPSEEEGLDVLLRKDALEDEAEQAKWEGPYLEDPVVEDAWGTAIVYRYPSEIREGDYYDLISYGPDREEGGDDDITNHDRKMNSDGELREEFEDLGSLDDSAGP
ncbi:MAG: type II secretion system major pseudopilin GspG [Phycisphaerales bacterium]|nr:type II secretion system major pseudopilin GspG [Phycisphaerales bacterium]